MIETNSSPNIKLRNLLSLHEFSQTRNSMPIHASFELRLCGLVYQSLLSFPVLVDATLAINI